MSEYLALLGKPFMTEATLTHAPVCRSYGGVSLERRIERRAGADCTSVTPLQMAVTMPFKIEIKKLVDDLTPAARQLGAVNTVSPRLGADGKRFLLGDNTDWASSLRNVSA